MPPADIDALYANLEDHYAHLARMSGSEYHRDADVAWFVSGRTENFFNAVVSAAFEPTAAARRVDEVLRPFVDRGIPMRWWTDERGLAADLDGLLERRGFELRWDVPGMTMDLASLVAARTDVASPDGLEVRRVLDEAGLRAWAATFATAYGLPKDAADVWFAALAELGLDRDAPLRRYLGLLGGEPVATATMHLGGGAAGLYQIGTIPEVRRRGIGAEVTLAPLLEARAEGVRFGVLKASDLGRGVYERLGFRERTRLRQYRLTP